MRRRQLFEFHELPWYPSFLREVVVEVLDRANRSSGFAEAISEPFARVLEESGAETVLDLCSGAGGPVVQVVEALGARGASVPRVLLSDLYPHPADWEQVRARTTTATIDFVEQSVDATALPSTLDGDLITIINALHHFPPAMVEAILGQAINRGSSIFVAEGFPRNLFRATAYLPPLLRALPAALLTTKRARLAKLVAGLPLLPVLGGWDWLVSALRIHEPAELIATAERLAPHYRWSHGEEPFPPWGRAVYLVGIAG